MTRRRMTMGSDTFVEEEDIKPDGFEDPATEGQKRVSSPGEEDIGSPGSITEKKTTAGSQSFSSHLEWPTSPTTCPPSRSTGPTCTGHEIPEQWQSMALKIRGALAAHRPGSTDIPAVSQMKSTMLLPDHEKAGGVQTPPVDYYIHITDEMREFAENVLGRGELTANQAIVSLDEMLRAVAKHNAWHRDASAAEFWPIIQRSHIVKKDRLMAEVYFENLTPQEQLRIRASERSYQRKMFGTIPLFKKLDSASNDEHTPQGIAIELSGSMAMAVSLLGGLLLSFVGGFFGGPYIGLKSPAARAVLGLVLAIAFLAVEVSLILIRYAKLERIRAARQRHHEHRLAQARRKAFGLGSTTPGHSTQRSPDEPDLALTASGDDSTDGIMRHRAVTTTE